MDIKMNKVLIASIVLVAILMLCAQWFAIWILWDAIKDINEAIDELQNQSMLHKSALVGHLACSSPLFYPDEWRYS